MWTIILLIGSNIFMTFAWYGHLKFREVALWKVILISWGIAFFEYCLQVPANRLGARQFTPDEQPAFFVDERTPEVTIGVKVVRSRSGGRRNAAVRCVC